MTNPMTRKHESLGYLVQSAGKGEWMVLNSADGSWAVVAVGFSSYSAACDYADFKAAG